MGGPFGLQHRDRLLVGRDGRVESSLSPEGAPLADQDIGQARAGHGQAPSAGGPRLRPAGRAPGRPRPGSSGRRPCASGSPARPRPARPPPLSLARAPSSGTPGPRWTLRWKRRPSRSPGSCARPPDGSARASPSPWLGRYSAARARPCSLPRGSSPLRRGCMRARTLPSSDPSRRGARAFSSSSRARRYSPLSRASSPRAR